MIVKAIWEFDVDISYLDPEFVNIPGLAQDLTKRELAVLLKKGDISEEDFEYLVQEV